MNRGRPQPLSAFSEHFHQVPSTRMEFSRVEVPRLPRPNEVQPMGPLLWLEVTYCHNRRRETWDFQHPRPWLMYSPARLDQLRARLWVSGGAFQFGPWGFRNTREPSGIERIPVGEVQDRRPRQWQRYMDTHYGAQPTQAVEVDLIRPTRLVALAWADAAAYETDRNDGDKLSPWRHPFRGRAKPLIATGHDGRGLYFIGGTYTVLNGWLV